MDYALFSLLFRSAVFVVTGLLTFLLIFYAKPISKFVNGPNKKPADFLIHSGGFMVVMNMVQQFMNPITGPATATLFICIYISGTSLLIAGLMKQRAAA